MSYLVQGSQLYQYAVIDGYTRLRLVTSSAELNLAAAKVLAEFVLSMFLFPVRCVQPDSAASSPAGIAAGPKTPLDQPVRAHPFTLMRERFGIAHRLIPLWTSRLTAGYSGRIGRMMANSTTSIAIPHACPLSERSLAGTDITATRTFTSRQGCRTAPHWRCAGALRSVRLSRA